ncbi:MAG: DNA repair protein RecO [Phycisphaerales bacterium]
MATVVRPIAPAVTYFSALATVHDDAFCIRVWDWSETSQTVSLFCRMHGVVRGLAKGAKRDEARFSGGFELLTRGQVGMILKSSDAMATLTSWDLNQTFPGARVNLPSFYSSMAMLDLVHHMVRDHDPHAALFDSLSVAASSLGSADRTIPALVGFLWSVLTEAGYRPELDLDVRTSKPLDAGAPLAFDAKLGGFTRWEKNVAEEGWRARPQTLELLRSLSESKPALGASDDVLRAGKLLYAYVRETAGAPIPSVERALQVLSG